MSFKEKITFVLFVSVILCSCYRNNEATLFPKSSEPGSSSCDTMNVSYSAAINPVLLQNCAIPGCHTGPSPTAGYTLDNYIGVRSVVLGGRLIGAITHAVGYSPMPKNGGMLSDCQVGLITSWVNQGAQNN
jgi:hypothetical protein